jgi:alkanesulfonate monooxygenase SsuD/methylene tetrahydromethanopterin reductase-like flavin-dependent oxidoreductase (luciferase family)
MNPSHTERTAATLAEAGRTVAVSPMMMCLRSEDPTEARRLCRRAIGYYTTLDYYHRAWRTLGFDDDDFADGGSDRLIDAIIAWGSIDEIRERLAAQRAAGAARVVVIPLNARGGGQPDWDLLSELGTING